MARFGITSAKAFGVGVVPIRALARELGCDHDLALRLWKTGWLEARMLAVFVDESERVTPVQMERWCRDFDNWAVCDAACFHLFDRTPHAFAKVRSWSRRAREFEKRAAFALLASLALHRKDLPDARFVRCLPLLERASTDERNYVKKSVLWALRQIGGRSPDLHAEALGIAARWAAATDRTQRWIGARAGRELKSSAALRRVRSQRRKAGAIDSRPR